MAELNDLLNAIPGQQWTAEEVRLIGKLLKQVISGEHIYTDSEGTQIAATRGGGSERRLVVLRLLDLESGSTGVNKMMAQQVKYTDSPPKEGVVVAYGNKFEVFPPPGHQYQSFDYLRSVLPLLGPLDEEIIHPNAFFVYECQKFGGYWIIMHVWRMPENVYAVDVDNIEASGGGSGT